MDSISSNRKRLLLSALKRDDKESFKNLYEIYQPRIFAFSVRYLKVVEDAEGITQEVFIELWKNRKKIDADHSLSSYLFTIAKNKIIDHFRKRQKQTLFNNYLQHYLEITDSLTENIPEESTSEKKVISAVKKLPEKRRIVFLLSKKFGLTRKEIADFLGISENTVKNQLQEALKYLRQDLHQVTVLIILFFSFFRPH